MNYTYVDIMDEISSAMNAKGVPELYQSEYKENLRDLQDSCRMKWGAMINDLESLERHNRNGVDAMFRTSTYALCDELEQARALRENPAFQPIVRQNASSIGVKRPRSPEVPSGSLRGDEPETSSSDEHDDDAEPSADRVAAIGIAKTIVSASASLKIGHPYVHISIDSCHEPRGSGRNMDKDVD
jgi:hypothetical protein